MGEHGLVVSRLPLLLTASRGLLIPLVLVLAHAEAPPWAFVLCLCWALLSDICDGILARRLGVDTPFLRQLDTVTDTLFYGAVLWAMWVLHPDVVTARAVWIGAILGLELAGYLVSRIKFGRGASHHALSAKLFGIALFAASTCLLGFGISGWVFDTAIVVGLVCEVESLAITLLLPAWRQDTRHIGEALRVRKS